MITDARLRLRTAAARIVKPHPLPDIVDFLEGRTFDRDGQPIVPLQLIDKDDPYRGPFNTENCPDIREILRSCVSRTTRRTVIVGPTQSFKTTIIVGVEAYTIAVDHGPIGHVLPNETPLARAFSTKRFQPIVDNTPWLRALKPDNFDLYKTLELGFTTCTLRFAGANSPGNLASWPYRRVIGDETDKFPQLIRNESGTRELLLQRTGQFAHWNGIDASTPTVPWGTIWQAALVGSCERYYVPCPHCSRPFTFRFSTDRTTLVWDEHAKHANGTWDLARVARSAHYRCPHCGGEIHENHRRDMLHAAAAPGAAAAGLGWRPDPREDADARRADYGLVGDPECRSFFRSCFNVLHPNRTFAAIACKFLKAGRDRSKLQNFWNSELGEVYESAISAAPDWKVLADRAENYAGDPIVPTDPVELSERYPAIIAQEPTDLLPEGCVCLTAGVDRQAEPARLEYEIVGWGEDTESWGIEYGAILRSRYKSWREVWDELDRRLQKIWRMPVHDDLTCPVTVAAASIDTGNEPDDCYDYVRRCVSAGRRVYAIKGSSEGYGQPLVERPKKSGVRKVELWMIGTTTAKAELYANLRNAEPGTTGYMHFPKHPRRGYDQDWYQQIRAERCETRMIGGRTQLRFIKPSGARNEALDIRVYARAALYLLNPKIEKIKARLGEQLPQPELPLTSESNQPDHGNGKHYSRDGATPGRENNDHGDITHSENPASTSAGDHASNDSRTTIGVSDDRERDSRLHDDVGDATFDFATGRIKKPATAPSPELRPNTYTIHGAKPASPEKPKQVRMPRRGSWATRW